MDTFPQTIQFLEEHLAMGNVQHNSTMLLFKLLQTISSDGFSLVPVEDPTVAFDHHPPGQHLRRLQETSDPNSSEFVMNLVLALVCVICAGFASGLTQVIVIQCNEIKCH